MQLADKSRAWRVVLAQLAASLLITLALLAVADRHALSALAGGVTAALSNGLFGVIVFSRYKAQQPGQLVARFYGAELAKLVITALSFALAMLWLKPISIGGLLGAYLAVSLAPALITHFLKH